MFFLKVGEILMADFDWKCVESKLFSTTNIENQVNADKLFISFLMEVENRRKDITKQFTLKEIAEIIPKGTAEINNYSTYGFSFMSMLSGQKNRDYFIFENKELRDEFTSICNNNYDRDNYFWKKHYLNEQVRVNHKYLKHK
jgi:5-methylcytosine-specific restriction enzyme A